MAWFTVARQYHKRRGLFLSVHDCLPWVERWILSDSWPLLFGVASTRLSWMGLGRLYSGIVLFHGFLLSVVILC